MQDKTITTLALLFAVGCFVAEAFYLSLVVQESGRERAVRASMAVTFHIIALSALIVAFVLNLMDRVRAKKLRIALQSNSEEYTVHIKACAKTLATTSEALEQKRREYLDAMDELKALRISERDATTQLKHVKDELDNTKRYAHVLSWQVAAWPNASLIYALANRAGALHARLSEMLKLANVKGNNRWAQLLGKPLSDPWPIDTDTLNWSIEKWRFYEDCKDLRDTLPNEIVNVPIQVRLPNEMSSADTLGMLQDTISSLRDHAAKRLESSESATISETDQTC